tara:strand:+ start:174 stop:317 length:144 start_codon:yes stop_codon:yes gene_type:complete
MYTPQSSKNQSPITLSGFKQKAIKLPRDLKALNKDKFRLNLKNKLNR